MRCLVGSAQGSLTFGSLGDILQLCQIAFQLSQAVGVGSEGVGESVKEYQELRGELDFFVQILAQVVATYETHELSSYLAGLDQATKHVVNQTASLIQEALDRLQSRYQNSLQPEGSGSKFTDVRKKIKWSIREKGWMGDLRRKLQESIRRLQLLTSLAASRSARVDNAVLLDRVTEVQTLLSRTHTGQEEMFRLMQQRRESEEQAPSPDETGQTLVQQDNCSQSVLDRAGDDALSAILRVEDLLVQVSQDAINVDMVFNSTHLRPMDFTDGLPAIIEDALGRHVPIPPVWLDFLDWEALHRLLSCLFKDRNGHDMVIRREYALEESASGRDLDPERPLHLCLRRGMKVNMSMIFETTEPLFGTCPRCNTEQDAPEGVTVQCPNSDCGMLFSMRRTDSSQPISAKDGESSDLGTEAVSSTAANPADFKRVRFFCYNTHLTQSIISTPSIETASIISTPSILAESIISIPSIEAASIISTPSIETASIISTPSITAESIITPTIAVNTSVKRILYHTLFRKSPPRRRVVWVWICCYCGHGGGKVSVDPCPRCGVSRCPNCDTQRLYAR